MSDEMKMESYVPQVCSKCDRIVEQCVQGWPAWYHIEDNSSICKDASALYPISRYLLRVTV
jgi:hypothetical protein